MYDAIVIGGGIVGMSAAYHLAKGGAKTLLVDRHHAGRATDAGAGILAAAIAGVRLGPDWFRLSVAAMDYYPALIDQLRQEQAADTGYAVCGSLMVAVDEDEVGSYDHALQIIHERQQQRGAPSSNDLYEISSEQAQALFPPLAPVRSALYYQGAARVDGRMLTTALLNAAVSYQLEQKDAEVERLTIQDEQITGVVADGETFAAGKVIIAGGAWSQRFGDPLGVQIPVTPHRGQIIHLDLPGTDTSGWCVVLPFHGHYIVPWADSRVVVGATREANVGFNPVTTAAGMRDVLDEAIRVAPGLASAQFREIRVGLRPGTPDDLPVLGSVPGVANLYLSTGHGASGLQLGPFSGRLAADWVLGQPPETDISAFHVSRFGA